MRLVFALSLSLIAALFALRGSEASEETREFLEFVDPRLKSLELPPAPSRADRIAILRMLDSIRVHCRVDNPDVVPTYDSFTEGAARLKLESVFSSSLAYIILTEKKLSMRAIYVAIDGMVAMKNSDADRWVEVIYRASPILADRFVLSDTPVSELEMVRNTHANDIRFAVSDAVKRSNNERLGQRLRKELIEQKWW